MTLVDGRRESFAVYNRRVIAPRAATWPGPPPLYINLSSVSSLAYCICVWSALEAPPWERRGFWLTAGRCWHFSRDPSRPRPAAEWLTAGTGRDMDHTRRQNRGLPAGRAMRRTWSRQTCDSWRCGWQCWSLRSVKPLVIPATPATWVLGWVRVTCQRQVFLSHIMGHVIISCHVGGRLHNYLRATYMSP